MFSKKSLLIFLFLLSGINLFAARYSSSSCTQLNTGTTALPGSTGNQVIRVDLVGTGNNSGSSWTLSSITFSLTNSSNYSSAKLYYGTSTSFSSATLIKTINNPGSTAAFSGFSTTPTASGGTATTISLFLVVDLKSTISCNNDVIDASVANNGLNIGGNGGANNLTPSSNNPSGNGNVSSSVTPTITIAGSATSICAGSSVTFTPTITNGGASPAYQWKVNGSNSGTASTFTSTTLANSDIVTCVLTSNHVCASTSTATSNAVTMTVDAYPSASITQGSSVNVCPPTTTTTLNASTNQSGVTYAWKKDGITISGASASTYAANFGGSYIVTVTNATGCSATSTATVVNMGNSLAIAAGSSASSICPGSTINLTTTNSSNFTKTFTNNTTISIPDNSSTGASSTIDVSGLPNTLTGATVTVSFSINHTYNDDLEVYLLKPGGSITTATSGSQLFNNVSGSSITLTSDNGGSGANYSGTLFTDAASSNITSINNSNISNISGSYRPEQAFSTLSGNPNGTWSLKVYDDATTDTGSLTSWTINITYPDGTTYAWTSSPAGFTSTVKNPSNVAISNTTTYTVVATDQIAGCTSSSSVTVYGDTLKPAVNCSNISVNLNSAGQASITASQINNGSTDNCTITSIVATKTNFDCSNIGANSVYLIVTDNSGNIDSCLATVTIIDNIKPTVNCTNLTVALDITGNATVSPASVDNSSTDNCSISNLSLSKSSFNCQDVGVNNVYLIATDASGNKDSCLTTITITSDLSASASITSEVNCFGGNATVLITATGGSGVYNGTGSVQVVAGNYNYTVTDNNGCTSSTSISVSQPTELIVTGIKNDPLCHDDVNGSINLSVSGGTPNYSFAWSSGQTTEDISSLPGSIYTVTVTDNNGCATSNDFTLTNPAALTATITTNNNSCYGGNTGTASANVSGGTSTYSYLWDNDNETTSSISGLFAGFYNVIINDQNNCTISVPFVITQPDPVDVQILNDNNTQICYNSSISLTGYIDGSYQSLIWHTTGDGTFSNDTDLSPVYTPGTNDIALGNVDLTLEVLSQTGCSTFTASITVLVKNKPAKPAPITGPSMLCLDNTGSFSITPSSDANSYAWSTGNASSITSGQGSTSVNVYFPPSVTNSGTYIFVSGVNECGTSLASQVWVRHNVGAAQFQVGPNSVCPGSSNVYYRVRTVDGADSIHWNLPPGCSFVSQNDTSAYIDFSNSYNGGTINVIAYFACGNSHASLKTNIPITRVPGNITGPLAGLCDTTVTYSIAAVSGAASYLWVVPAGANIVGASNGTTCTVQFNSGFTTGVISVYSLNICGVAGGARSLSVKGIPQTPTVINGPNTICAFQQNVVYSTPSITGVNSYLWSVPSTATIVSGQGTNSITVNFGNKSGGINVQANRTCSGNSSTKSLGYTINCREGISEAVNSLSVLPNPSHGNFSVAYTSDKVTTTVISIIDFTGRIIYQEEKQSAEGLNEFPMQTNLAAGMYILRTESGNDLQQKTFIVE